MRNLVPRDLGREAEAGRVDLGLHGGRRLPAAAGPLRAARAADGRRRRAAPVQSVLLFSRRPGRRRSRAR